MKSAICTWPLPLLLYILGNLLKFFVSVVLYYQCLLFLCFNHDYLINHFSELFVILMQNINLDAKIYESHHTLQRKSHLCIPRKGIARPQFQFPHSCVRERDLYFPRIGPHIYLQQNRQTDQGNIWSAHRYMNVEIGVGLTDVHNPKNLFFYVLFIFFSYQRGSCRG